MGSLAGDIIGGIGVASGLASGAMGFMGAREEEKQRMRAMKLRLMQVEDQTRQTSINQMRQLNHTLASQAAINAARGGGGAVGMPNMTAIADINQLAEDENVDKLNEAFQKEAIYSGEQQAAAQGRAKEMGSIVGGIGTAIQSGFDMYHGFGTKNTTTTQSTPSTSVVHHAPTPIENQMVAYNMQQTDLGLPKFDWNI